MAAVGDRADIQKKTKAFTEKGFVLVSNSYRFVPNVTVDQIAGDVAKAIRWTHDLAVAIPTGSLSWAIPVRNWLPGFAQMTNS